MIVCSHCGSCGQSNSIHLPARHGWDAGRGSGDAGWATFVSGGIVVIAEIAEITQSRAVSAVDVEKLKHYIHKELFDTRFPTTPPIAKWNDRHQETVIYTNQNVTLPAGTATYALVPGGGHGAWCYEPVKMLLEDAGQTVYAVSLPGVGERADELTTNTCLEDHIQAVADFITEHDLHDVILVGHSYGGMVITGAADRVPDRVKNIVYLDAVHPANGQSLLDAQSLVQYVPAVSQPRTVDGVEVNLYPDEDTITFLGLTEPLDVVFAKEHLTPHPWKTFTDKLQLENADIVSEIGKTDIYTKTTLDGLLQAGLVTEDEAKNAMVIDTGHDLMITEPKLTADMLLNAAAEIYGN